MDELKNLPPELILAAVGVMVALVLLVILSSYQKARAARAEKAKREELSLTSAKLPDTPAGKTPFFIACYSGNNGRFFRVYVASGELLFVDAGQFFMAVDPELPRRTDERHWMLRSGKLLAVTLGGGAAAAGLAGTAIAWLVARGALENSQGMGHFLLIILGLVVLLAVVAMLLTPSVLAGIARRSRELDALPLADLRHQAERDAKSLAASPATVGGIKFSLADSWRSPRAGDEVGCVLSFKHAQRGKWRIQTLATRDTRDAIDAAFAIWKPEQIELEWRLASRLRGLGGAAEKQIAAIAASWPDVIAQEPEPEPELDDLIKPKPGTSSVNGCGTMVCESRGIVDWGNTFEDSDAILAFCIVGLPIVPYRAVHTSDWRSYNPRKSLGGWIYQSTPIRWSWGLLAGAYVRSWGLLALAVGIVSLFVAYGGREGVLYALGLAEAPQQYDWLDNGIIRLLLVGAGLLLVPIAIAARWRLGKADVRHRDIRLVLGRHWFGSSDPLYWTDESLQIIRSPELQFGAETFAEASRTLLAKGDYVAAMFAARLSAALENVGGGEQLTDAILAAPQVAEVLQRLRRKPSSRDLILAEAGWPTTKVLP